MSDFHPRFSGFEHLALQLESLSERVARSGATDLPLCVALLREWRGTFDGELAAFEAAVGAHQSASPSTQAAAGEAP